MNTDILRPSGAQADDLSDVQDLLVLLSLALALIASPTTPIIVARVTAVLAQHTAMAWVELLDDLIAVQGGAQ
ncbi:hypothetical protein [Pseudomonas hormoni]